VIVGLFYRPLSKSTFIQILKWDFTFLGRCINNIGSYECLTTDTLESGDPDEEEDRFVEVSKLCEPGYVFNHEDNVCVDVDECLQSR
jgi:hypothetical protein